MKIRIPIPLVIEVDAREWASTAGLCDTDGRYDMTDVRADMRAYVLNAIQHAATIDETRASVTLAAE